jgi:hypothetical protein
MSYIYLLNLEKKEYEIKKWPFLKAPKGDFGAFVNLVNALIPNLYKNLPCREIFLVSFYLLFYIFRHKRGSDKIETRQFLERGFKF